MRNLYLFEFMDLSWLPRGLKTTETEILDTCNDKPFRNYFPKVINFVEECLKAKNFENIIELGAGSAPITRRLITQKKIGSRRAIVADLKPSPKTLSDLTNSNNFQKLNLSIIEKPVDFTKEHDWPNKSLVVISSAFHHVPPDKKKRAIGNLVKGSEGVIITEALRKNISSILLCLLLGWVAALITPFLKLKKPGNLRRIFWCWLFPLAPILFVFDGVISCLRCWSPKEWEETIKALNEEDLHYRIEERGFSQFVLLINEPDCLNYMEPRICKTT